MRALTDKRGEKSTDLVGLLPSLHEAATATLPYSITGSTSVIKTVTAAALLASLTGCALPPDHNERMERVMRGLASDLPRIQQEQIQRRRDWQARQPIRQEPTQTDCMRIGENISCTTR